MNSWIGSTKSNLVLHFGPPPQTASDENGGNVFVYSQRHYGNFNGSVVDYWEYKMFYINQSGIVYHWRIERSPNPPTRIDLNLFIH